METFNRVFPLDIHQPVFINGKIEVPVLKEEELTTGYHILMGNPLVHTYIRDIGFASVLRIYGEDPNRLLEKLKDGEKLSLLPEGSYYKSWDGMDKYYSGLKAFRNATQHSRIQDILPHLNCGRLLKRLLSEDPINWKASSDDSCIPYECGKIQFKKNI